MISEKDIIVKHLKLPYRSEEGKISNCWTTVKSIYHDLGYDIVDLEDFTRNVSRDKYEELLDAYRNQFRKVEVFNKWDMVLLQFGGCLHAGVVLGNNRFIHTRHGGTSINRIHDRVWQSKIIGFYRVIK